MADMSPTTGSVSSPGSKGFEPDVPIATSPMFDWPPRPQWRRCVYLVKPVMLPYGVWWVALAALCVELPHAVDGAHGEPSVRGGFWRSTSATH